jgi:hypothetical protein
MAADLILNRPAIVTLDSKARIFLRSLARGRGENPVAVYEANQRAREVSRWRPRCNLDARRRRAERLRASPKQPRNEHASAEAPLLLNSRVQRGATGLNREAIVSAHHLGNIAVRSRSREQKRERPTHWTVRRQYGVLRKLGRCGDVVSAAVWL